MYTPFCILGNVQNYLFDTTSSQFSENEKKLFCYLLIWVYQKGADMSMRAYIVSRALLQMTTLSKTRPQADQPVEIL